jgi:hypothetical protein
MENSDPRQAKEVPLKRLLDVIDGYNAAERRSEPVKSPGAARILPFEKKPKTQSNP